MSSAENPRALGQHWILDAEGCAAPGLDDRGRFLGALTQVPRLLGLTPVGAPQVFFADSALMGLVLLSESHFSLHLLIPSRRLHADIFSCQPFRPEPARALLEELFGFSMAREHYFARGLEGIGT